MWKIPPKERNNRFTYWEEQLDENIVYITITDDYEFVIKAMTEANLNMDERKEETLRVMFYAKGKGWVLSEESYESIAECGIFGAICHEHSLHTGDIYYYYEKGKNNGYEEYNTVYDMMMELAEYKEFVTVLEMSDMDFREIYDLLRPGDYMLHIPYSEKR